MTDGCIDQCYKENRCKYFRVQFDFSCRLNSRLDGVHLLADSTLAVEADRKEAADTCCNEHLNDVSGECRCILIVLMHELRRYTAEEQSTDKTEHSNSYPSAPV